MILFCSQRFSCSCRLTNTRSTVPRPSRNPHCDSGQTLLAILMFSLARSTLANTFPATDSTELSMQLPQAHIDLRTSTLTETHVNLLEETHHIFLFHHSSQLLPRVQPTPFLHPFICSTRRSVSISFWRKPFQTFLVSKETVCVILFA